MNDKYTEQELIDTWRIVLNSPTITGFWKGYGILKDWDLLTDNYVLSLIEKTLDEFRIREYKAGRKGACILWGRDLKQALVILKERAVPFADYTKSHSETEMSVEILSELGGLSEEEIEVLQKAGVLRVGEESQDYYNLSELLFKAEFFEAYCDGLLFQIQREMNTPEMKALRMKERQIRWEKYGKYLVGGFKPLSKSNEQGNSLEEVKKITIEGFLENKKQLENITGILNDNQSKKDPINIADWKKGHGFEIDSEGFILFDGTPREFLEQYGKENWLPDNHTLSLNVKTQYGKEYILKNVDAWNKAQKPPRKRK